jgi:hypothetical protein
MKIIWVSIVAGLLLIAGCGSLPQGFSMHPALLQAGEPVPADMAVILVGVSGPATVDYLQFGHSSMPAINARFPAKGNTIVPIAIPVGIKQLTLSTITLGGRRSGYLQSGMSYGYIAVRTPKLDIEKPGLYYIATLDTNFPGQYQSTPIREQLKAFQATYRATAGKLEPANFKWPD